MQVSRLESEIISFNSFNRTAKNAQNILNIADDAAASVQSGIAEAERASSTVS